MSALSNRESEVFCLVAEGHTNKEIARQLGITDGTVKVHVQSILRKFSVHRRTELIVLAFRSGAVPTVS